MYCRERCFLPYLYYIYEMLRCHAISVSSPGLLSIYSENATNRGGERNEKITENIESSELSRYRSTISSLLVTERELEDTTMVISSNSNLTSTFYCCLVETIAIDQTKRKFFRASRCSAEYLDYS
jgi:hypothetical protein